ncbi:uncharacterized protein LOC135150742 [Daucus carota subsp. sativus]|uniref:uncharacterized protein LOC135150742 n=1 Tax=Daucus carota subsp. sativus TaxID=79200 RepID=UPI003082FB26
MAEIIPPSRLIYVYVVTLKPFFGDPPVDLESQVLNPSQVPLLEYHTGDKDDAGNERVGGEHAVEDERNDEGVRDQAGEGEMSEEGCGQGERNEDGSVDMWWSTSDSEDEDYKASTESGSSFHSDSSNMDSTDEDFANHKQQRTINKASKASASAKKGGREKHLAKKGSNVVDKDNASEAASKSKGKEKIGAAVDNEVHTDENSSDSTKYADSEEERMAPNSTDDEEITYSVFDEKSEMDNPKFELGQMFPSAKVFRDAVKKQAIVERRPIIQCRNYGSRVKFICEGTCEWSIYASKMQRSDTYQIKVYEPNHTCTQTFNQKQINSKWIAEYYEDDIRMNPTWPLSAFLKKVVNDWGCHVSIYAIARAKRKALEKINGRHVEQYSRVWDYAQELLKAMPDSTVLVTTENAEEPEKKRFQRFYTCFGPIKKGFSSGCRPLIGLDGCHLKGPYGGQLLSAIGTDANDGMYPLAWAVVEAENSDSWSWFLANVVSDLKITNDGSWTFISDRQKGLINALESIVPNAEHRFCVMHLYRNMWKEHKGIGVRPCLWKAARATTEYTYVKCMDEMKKVHTTLFYFHFNFCLVL